MHKSALVTLGIVPILAACPAVADVNAYAVGRYVNYTQTSDAQPAAPDVWNLISVVVSDVGGEVQSSNMSVDRPPLATFPLGEAIPTLWYYTSPYYTDYAQFMLDYPASTYTFDADRGMGPESGDVFVPEDWYCAEVPYFTGDTYTRMQNIDVDQPFTATINGFSLNAATPEGATSVVIAEDGQPGSLWSISLEPGETSFDIPANLLQPGRRYTIGLTYLNQLRIPGAGFAGSAISGAEFYRATGAAFTTPSEPLPCNPEWVDVSPSSALPGPGFRLAASACWDGSRVIMFGGGVAGTPTGSGTLSSETWGWDGAFWTLLATAGPPAQTYGAMSYDSDRGRVVSFRRLGTQTNTWEWDGSSWSQVSAAGPTNTDTGVMAYDSARHKTVYVSYNVTTGAGQTWEWDGATWALRAVSTPSGVNAEQAMCFDEARGECLLVNHGQTWSYDGTLWVLLATGTPSARFSEDLVYDPVRQKCVLYGGQFGVSIPPQFDTWEWDGTAWTQIAISPPDSYALYASAWDNAHNCAVLYGGFLSSGARSDRTWVYTSTVAIGSSPAANSLNEGDTAEFRVSAYGAGTLTYQWRKDGVALLDGPTATGSVVLGSLTAVLQVSNASPADMGSFDCVVTNHCGDAASTAATLEVVTSGCDSIDFNNDTLFPDTQDIDDFLSVFSGGPCSNDPNCGDIDFNNDTLFPDTLDIDSLLSVFSGGPCL